MASCNSLKSRSSILVLLKLYSQDKNAKGDLELLRFVLQSSFSLILTERQLIFGVWEYVFMFSLQMSYLSMDLINFLL